MPAGLPRPLPVRGVVECLSRSPRMSVFLLTQKGDLFQDLTKARKRSIDSDGACQSGPYRDSRAGEAGRPLCACCRSTVRSVVKHQSEGSLVHAISQLVGVFCGGFLCILIGSRLSLPTYSFSGRLFSCRHGRVNRYRIRPELVNRAQ